MLLCLHIGICIGQLRIDLAVSIYKTQRPFQCPCHTEISFLADCPVFTVEYKLAKAVRNSQPVAAEILPDVIRERGCHLDIRQRTGDVNIGNLIFRDTENRLPAVERLVECSSSVRTG